MEILPSPAGDILWVGSNRDYLYAPAVTIGEKFGFSEEEVLAFFGGDLVPPFYVGDYPDSRGRIFRCNVDDADSWETAYISPVEFPEGEGDPVPRYRGFRAMRTFTDSGDETALYVATHGSQKFPSQILKFGQEYERGMDPEVCADFPGAISVRNLVVHGGALYAASFGNGGCMLWASDDPAIGNWTLVADASDFPLGGEVPEEYPRDIPSIVSFAGSLYVFIAVANMPPGFYPEFPLGVQGGFWVYRSDDPAVGNWEETMRYGAGNHWNEVVSNAAVFDDHVYVGTALSLVQHLTRMHKMDDFGKELLYWLYLTLNWKGTDVLRFDADDNWELVIGNPEENSLFDDRIGDYGEGFDNSSNTYSWWMDVFDEKLLVGTYDSSLLQQLMNFFGARLETDMGAENPRARAGEGRGIGQENPQGGDLWATVNGAHWFALTLNGFDDEHNYGFRSLISTDTDLFVGTANPFYGTEIWKLSLDR
jgi:hypothetical protein